MQINNKIPSIIAVNVKYLSSYHRKLWDNRLRFIILVESQKSEIDILKEQLCF